MLTEKIQLLAKVREQAREQMMENRDHIRSLSVFGAAIGEHLRLRLHCWSEVMFRCCSDMYMSCEESKNSKLRSSTLADASPVEWHSLHFVSDSISRLVISPAILLSFLRKDRQRGDVVIEVAARLESKKKEKKETAAKSPVCVWSLKCDENQRHTYVRCCWSGPRVICSKVGGPRAALAQGASGAAWSRKMTAWSSCKRLVLSDAWRLPWTSACLSKDCNKAAVPDEQSGSIGGPEERRHFAWKWSTIF